MEVKIMRFRVSNAASSPCSDDYGTGWYKRELNELDGISEIEEIINDFIYRKKVISIQVSTVDVKYHNNARGNTVDLIYTILYKDEE